MRVLAVDHGAARCGVALSDPTGTIARPLEVVEPPDPAVIARIAVEHGAELILVGLPLDRGGGEGEQARAVRTFCAELERAVPIPVGTWDERLTTVMAASSRRSGARGAEDSLAAAHLLESYLASPQAPGRAPSPPGSEGGGDR